MEILSGPCGVQMQIDSNTGNHGSLILQDLKRGDKPLEFLPMTKFEAVFRKWELNLKFNIVGF